MARPIDLPILLFSLTWVVLGVLFLDSAWARPEGALQSIVARSDGRMEAGRIAARSAPARPSARLSVPASTGSASPGHTLPARLDPVSVERTERYAALIDHHARRQGVDGNLVKAIIYTESGGDRRAVSASGAIGLMQLMPETAGDLGIADPFDAEASIDGGTRYLASLLDRFGSTEVALWAYNAGPGAVARGILPDETAAYVPRVLSLRRLFESRGITPSHRPDDLHHAPSGATHE